MDLNKLKAFITVAEELNFRRSAEILGMSQPPLTRLIASLEKDLDTKLFNRTTRSVSLTGAGVLLLKESREISAAILRIETEVRAVGKIRLGRLKIGFSRTAFLTRFPSIIEEFQSRFPKIKLDLLEKSNQEVVTLLKEGNIDVAFSEKFFQNERVKSQQIASENVGVLLPRKHFLAKKKDVQFSELRNETVILHSRREAIEYYDRTSHFLSSGAKKQQVYIKNQNESCPILVATGRGISFIVNGGYSVIPDQLRLVHVSDMFVPIFMTWSLENNTSQLKSFLSLVIEKQNILPHRAECLTLSNELKSADLDSKNPPNFTLMSASVLI